MKVDLQAYLSEFRGQDVVYIPNPGNAGDSVIAAATYQYLDRAGIKYGLPNPHKFDPAGKIVLYGGGGNLVGPATFSAKLLSRIHRRAKKLVVLPHTIKGVDQLLSCFGNNIDLICREQVSRDYVGSICHRPGIYLSNDMAFTLDVDDLLKRGDRNPVLFEVASYVRGKSFGLNNAVSAVNIFRMLRKRRIQSSLMPYRSKRSLTCFRTDPESAGQILPSDNLDLSDIVAFGVETKGAAFFSARQMLRFLSHFDEIQTDRLHIAISSALLGKRVLLYANNYYKVRAVYEYSMQNKFPNVSWVGGSEKGAVSV